MADDFSVIHTLVTGMTTAAIAIFTFFGKRIVNKVDETAKALALHEKEDVGKYATVSQLDRVHSRIDESAKAVEAGFKEMRKDIGEVKTLLMKG